MFNDFLLCMCICVSTILTITIKLVQNLLVARDKNPTQTSLNKDEDLLFHETGMSGINQG